MAKWDLIYPNTDLIDLYTGWWFGTWLDYDFPFSWECHNPNWRTPSFFRGAGQPPTSYNFLLQMWNHVNIMTIHEDLALAVSQFYIAPMWFDDFHRSTWLTSPGRCHGYDAKPKIRFTAGSRDHSVIKHRETAPFVDEFSHCHVGLPE